MNLCGSKYILAPPVSNALGLAHRLILIPPPTSRASRSHRTPLFLFFLHSSAFSYSSTLPPPLLLSLLFFPPPSVSTPQAPSISTGRSHESRSSFLHSIYTTCPTLRPTSRRTQALRCNNLVLEPQVAHLAGASPAGSPSLTFRAPRPSFLDSVLAMAPLSKQRPPPRARRRLSPLSTSLTHPAFRNLLLPTGKRQRQQQQRGLMSVHIIRTLHSKSKPPTLRHTPTATLSPPFSPTIPA